jgi:hypothetical protein
VAEVDAVPTLAATITDQHRHHARCPPFRPDVVVILAAEIADCRHEQIWIYDWTNHANGMFTVTGSSCTLQRYRSTLNERTQNHGTTPCVLLLPIQFNMFSIQ